MKHTEQALQCAALVLSDFVQKAKKEMSMKLRFPKSLAVVAVLAGVALLGAPNQAHATFEVRYSTNGGTTFTTIADNAAGDTNSNADVIQVNVTGIGTLKVTSQANLTTTVALTQLDLQVNGTNLTGALNLVVQATVNNLTTAPPPLSLLYNFADSSLLFNALGVTKTIQTTVDDNNNLFGISGPGTAIVADTTALTTPASGQIDGIIASNPYSLTTSIHFQATGSKKSNTAKYSIGFDSNNEIDPSPVPAPASLLLALIGAPVFGVGAWLRRRRVAA